jgi:hypothetical protein
MSLYNYDAVTGHFTRRTPHNRLPVGSRSGSTLANGYRHIHVDGRRYYEHRLAWLYMTGEWPAEQVDHKDLNRANNAWSNLREATNQTNMRNGSLRKDNKSGFKGVTWRPDHQRWRATIKTNGKQTHIGNFRTKEEAAAAYDAAAIEHFGEFANPNSVLASPNPPLEDRPCTTI